MSFFKTIKRQLEESQSMLIEYRYLLSDKQKDELKFQFLTPTEYMQIKGFKISSSREDGCIFEKNGVSVCCPFDPDKEEVPGLIKEHERLCLLKEDLEKLNRRKKQK